MLTVTITEQKFTIILTHCMYCTQVSSDISTQRHLFLQKVEGHQRGRFSPMANSKV